MGKIRGELEDLAFRYLDPAAYDEIAVGDRVRRGTPMKSCSIRTRQMIEGELRREGIPARADGRLKRAYSIYQKSEAAENHHRAGVRLDGDSHHHRFGEELLRGAGCIHNDWRPVPGRIKDFIAIPGPTCTNPYIRRWWGRKDGISRCRFGPKRCIAVAEEGIAAHWKYKEGKKGPADDDQRIAWLRHLVEWQRDMQDPGEFLSTLKVDLYPEEVYTFTPRGKVIVLPRDATAIDFAYAIHSDVGQQCVGAKVNGRIVPLRYTLRNGDIVEILTQPGHEPSKDWLALVKTSRARNKIKHVINANERVRAIEIGEKYLEKEARRLGVQLSKIQRADLERVAGEYGVSKIEDLYAALGYGKFSARQALQKLVPQLVKEEQLELPKPGALEPAPGPGPQGPQDGDSVIRVKGVDDLMVYRAKCCNPIRGEAIVGYVTRGKGVAVHSKMCPNVQNLMYDVERKIDVEWARNTADAFPVRIVVHTDDRPGLLAQITSILSSENTNIRSLEARTENGGADRALVEMTVDVRDKKQLEKLVSAMRRISGIRDVERLLN